MSERAAAHLKLLFGELEGFVALAVGFGGHFNAKDTYEFKSFAEDFHAWPEQLEAIVATAEKYAPDADVYVCPLIRRSRSRKAGTGGLGRYAWADVDTAPANGWAKELLGPRGFVVSSGRGKHPYLFLPELLPAAELEQLNRRLALRLDADAGWSETKYLRLAGTLNHKERARGASSQPVDFLNVERGDTDWTLAELEHLLPEGSTTNGAEPVEPIAPRDVPPAVRARLNELPDGDRSDQTWGFVATCVEEGLTDAEVIAVALEHPPTVEKYGKRAAAEVARVLGKVRGGETEGRRARAPRALTSTPLSQVEKRSIRWLEKPLWQRSAFELFVGAKGSGKGTYTSGLGARLTRAGLSVLFISSEDSAEIDLAPRLEAAGADMDRAHVVQQHVKLPEDVPALRELAGALENLVLIVVDPVANHIGDRNSNSDAEVRDAIAPLNRLADELDCLVIGVRHPSKDRSRGAVASVLGSTAWVDTPRAVVMVVVDDADEDVRHIQVVAGNRSRNGRALSFRIEEAHVEGLEEPVTRAVELGESAKSVDALMVAGAGNRTSKGAEAREIILDVLEEDGEQESDALDARVAKETGLAARTARDVRMALSAEGLVKAFPEKDEFGAVVRWLVTRSQAPRT